MCVRVAPFMLFIIANLSVPNSAVRAEGGCTTSADCQDGFFCTGAEVCTAGACGQGTTPCSALQTCDEGNDTCIDLNACMTFRNSDFTLPGNFYPQCPEQNPCITYTSPHYSFADDIELAKHSSRWVTSYSFYTQARDPVQTLHCCNIDEHCMDFVGTPYLVKSALMTVAPGTCFPDQVIPGSTCDFSPGVIAPNGAPADVFTCQLSAPVLVPDGTDIQECVGKCSDTLAPCTDDSHCHIEAACEGTNLGASCLSDADCGDFTTECLDTGVSQCGIDFFISVSADSKGAGVSIGCTNSIGGPGIADEVATDAMVFATCTNSADPFPGQWEGWRFALAGPGGGCPVNRGNFRGLYVCTEPTGACCDPVGGTCSPQTPDECANIGGTYLSEIQVDGTGSCADGSDQDADGTRDECDLCDDDAHKTAPGHCGCGIADTDSDGDGTANCLDQCMNDPHKTEPGSCGCGIPDTDSDNDGWSDCDDQCPNDPNKIAPGSCGCGTPETGDSDGDAVSDCVDICPGADDAVFAPGCTAAIPAVNEWGFVIAVLAILVVSKTNHRRQVQAVIQCGRDVVC